MPSRKFRASEGLVEKVATKQSGVIEKAWLEAVMNSVDAGAKNIELIIEEEWSQISDDGQSMTQEEVEQYFEYFGLEDDDIEEKEFGKFRIGRGQIFNFGINVWRARENYMVVSLNDEQVTVNLKDCTTEDDESIIEVNDGIYTVDTSGLRYALLDAESIDEGLNIYVDHYNTIDDVSQSISNFKNLVKFVPWVHNVTITVNGEEVGEEPEIIEETDNAWYVKAPSSYSSYSPVYNKGAKVDTFSLGPKRISIISKRDLDVTLDRTDILDTNDYWAELKDEYGEVITSILLEHDDLSVEKRNWLIKQASNDIELMQDVMDKPLIRDVTGETWTLYGLRNKMVSFGSQDDEIAKDANDRAGVVMINEDFESSFNTFASNAESTIEESNILNYAEVVEEKLIFEMEETADEDLSKRRLKNLRVIRDALSDLGFADIIKAGYSNHKMVWKNDNSTLYIHKDYLNKNKNEIVTEVLFHIVRVAAHDGDTRAGMNESHTYRRNFYKMMKGERYNANCSFPEVQKKLMEGDYK